MFKMEGSYFITGIDTGCGKTVASAILTQALRAHYWKPVQCGDLEATDRSFVESVVCDNTKEKILSERFKFKLPQSPHLASEVEGVDIQLSDFSLPKLKSPVVVEGAGGVLVPLNKKDLMIDLIEHLGLPVVLVVKHYLGSLNHTLLTVEALRQRGILISGLIMNGNDNGNFSKFLCDKTDLPCLFSVPFISDLSKNVIQNWASGFRKEHL